MMEKTMLRVTFLILSILTILSIPTSVKAQQDIRVRDFGVLKIGETYNAPMEYCYSESDLRDVFTIHQSLGGYIAHEEWRNKVFTNFCVEDSLTDLTEFRVVRLIETYTFNAATVYIVEVVINGLSVFAIS